MENKRIIDLKESPIYAMSLGSKELFHSNFWAWLIETDHSFINVFFDDIDPSRITSLGREDRNRDITIYLEDGLSYIIENKIKSIPNNEQLKNYQDTPGFQRGILTGIKETLDIYDKNVWTFVSYKSISDKIMTHLKTSENEIIKAHKRVISQYCEDIHNLTDLMFERLSETDNILDYNPLALSDIRFDDVYKKFKAENFVEKHIKNNNDIKSLLPDQYTLWINTDYSNKHAIIDIRFTIPNLLGIGVQIEEDQFRIIADRSIANQCDQVFDEFLSLGWFDGSYDKKENQFIFGHQTKMKPNKGKQYNKYQTSRYSFVYQYFTLDSQTKQYEVLYQLIFKYLKKAKEITKLLKV